MGIYKDKEVTKDGKQWFFKIRYDDIDGSCILEGINSFKIIYIFFTIYIIINSTTYSRIRI